MFCWGLFMLLPRNSNVSSQDPKGSLFIWPYGCQPKNMGTPPKSSHLFIGFGTTIFTIHFGGFPFFGNIHILQVRHPKKHPGKTFTLYTTPWLGWCSQPTRIWVATLEPLATFTSKRRQQQKKRLENRLRFCWKMRPAWWFKCQISCKWQKKKVYYQSYLKKKQKWLQEPCLWAWKTYSPIEKWQESQ